MRKVRCMSLVVGGLNTAVVVTGGLLIYPSKRLCDGRFFPPILLVSLAALLRLIVMFQTALAQQAAATLILEDTADLLLRLRRRAMYKKWLCWSRSSALLVVLQFLLALYLVITSAHHFSTSNHCLLESKWNSRCLSFFTILVSFLAILHCFTGSDVFKWRSFYQTHHHAWKCHYSEVFDHGIRETLCCLGRVKYLTAMEEDEVYSVARLLGELVAYRASGTGHMELLAALALLQSQTKSSESYEQSMEVPVAHIREAEALHKFAEAAYTGPLLDVGRNPFVFLCAWLYRQGILCPWSRNRCHFVRYSILWPTM